jgi:hypothetical protein
MLRQICVIGVVASLAFASADLSACGDKFLRVGRSARFRRYAAVHPASILIYRPLNSTQAGIKEFEDILKRAGHQSRTVDNGATLAQVIAAANYDMVIADYADAGKIKVELQSTASRPRILPILYKPSKSIEVQAEQEYRCLIKPHAMTKYDALAEIDRLMKLRQDETSPVK